MQLFAVGWEHAFLREQLNRLEIVMLRSGYLALAEQ